MGVCAVLALSGCWGNSSDPPPPTYSLSATLSGLDSSGLVLSVNGTAVSVSAGTTTQSLGSSLPSGTSYSTTVQAQPTGETCAISGGTGTIQSANVTNVAVTCSEQWYTVGGSISGLISNGMVLINGSNTLAVHSGASSFTMPATVAYHSAYAVTVQTQPAGLTCSVSNGTGTMGADDVTNVSIACGSNFTLLYSFAGGSSDGANPHQYSLIQGSDSNFYGATLHGGTNDYGTVFKITPGGTETVLYSFPKKGSFAGLIQASDGNFYGTAANVSTNGEGSFFKLTPKGVETDLYTFPANSSLPYSGVIQGSDGNFYGTTGANGHNDDGTVFKFTPSGTKTVLHAFPKSSNGDGQIPYDSLIQTSDDTFYGTTYKGGANGFGTVFKITPGGKETVVYSFAGGSSDGANPEANLVQGSDGDFYGTTYNGGTHGLGTVFKITPSGTETILHSFAGSDGANPQAGVIQAGDGNFYGTTYKGGTNGLGTVFKITPSGTETVLHSFDGSDGENLKASLVLGRDGNLYGTTFSSGPSGFGTFFKITLQ